MDKYSIIIGNNDSTFEKKILEQVDSDQLGIVNAKDLDEFKANLRKNKEKIKGIFLCPSFYNSKNIFALQWSHKITPSIPIYLFKEFKKLVGKEVDENHLGIQKYLDSLDEFNQITKLINENAKILKELGDTNNVMKNNDELMMEKKILDEGMVGILAKGFLSGSKSFFDVYVRLRSNKYVKILEKGDAFSLDRVQSYLNKGVRFFYIREESQSNYMNYCAMLASKMVTDKKISLTSKVDYVENLSGEVFRFIKKRNFDVKSFEYAQSVATVGLQLCNHLKNKSHLIKHLLKNKKQLEHSLGVSFFTGIIAFNLGIKNQNEIQSLALASVIHDIGLYKENPSDSIYVFEEDRIKYQDERRLRDMIVKNKTINEKIKNIYFNHPLCCKEELRKLKVDNLVKTLIYEHHERKDGSGYPLKLQGPQIHYLSYVLGLADELIFLIEDSFYDEDDNDFGNLSFKVGELIHKFPLQIYRIAKNLIS